MSFLQAQRQFLKYAAIRAGLEAVAFSRAGALFPAAGGRGLVFTLHHVRPDRRSAFAPNAILAVTPQFLAQAVEAALEAGLTPAHLHDLPDLLADPSDKRRFVAFTLDDGYRDNAQFAAPVFRRFGVPYTIFVTSGFVERTRTLWWETAEALVRRASSFEFDFGQGTEAVASETRAQKSAAFARLSAFVAQEDEDMAVARIDEAAARAGADAEALVEELVMDARDLAQLSADPLVYFGAHTVSHVNLRRIDAQRLQAEIEQSAAAIERYAGYRPRSFSYPYGGPAAVSEREIEAAAKAGFPVAVTTQGGMLDASRLKRPTALPRVSLNGAFQKKRYVSALISGLPFRLA